MTQKQLEEARWACVISYCRISTQFYYRKDQFPKSIPTMVASSVISWMCFPKS